MAGVMAEECVVEMQCMLPATSPDHSPSMEDGQGLNVVITDPSGSVKTTLNPMLRAMTVFGLYYEISARCKVSLSLAFCVFIVFIATSNFFRMFFIYGPEDFATLMIKLMFHVWMFENCVCLYIFLLKINKDLPDIFRAWDDHRNSYKSVSAKHHRRYVVKVLLTFFLVYTPMVVGFFNVVSFMAPQFFRYMLSPHYDDTDPYDIPIMVRILYCNAHQYYNFVYLLPIVFIFTVSRMMGQEFDLVKNELEEYVASQRDDTDRFEGIRLRHLSLCKLVRAFDDAVSGIILCAAVIDVPLIALHVFMAMSEDESLTRGNFQFKLMVQIASCSVGIGHVLLATISGIMLSSKAKSIKGILYDVEVTKISDNTYRSLQMMMRKLTSDHIGLSAWGLLNVENGMVITIFSIICSYMFVMIRFGLTFGSTKSTTDAVMTPQPNDTININ